MRRKIPVPNSIAAALILAALSSNLASALPPADPTTSTSYPCYYVETLVWNYPGDGIGNVTGKVRFPSATCSYTDGPPSGRPILVFAHGNDMTYTDHDYLMAHLARNGFVTASIENSGSNEERASQMISYLNGMHTFWGWRTRLSDDVAFAGHSRGGEAAVTAARLLAETPALGAEPYDVEAVISIAPTDGGGGLEDDPRETLTGAATDGFLGLYGSQDIDVHGSPAFDGSPTEPQATVFAIYDRAGSEGSSEGFVFTGTHVDKAFVFIYGFAHRDFLDEGLGSSDGRNVAKAYFNAFLRWKVFGQTSYRGFFDGSWRPESLASLELFQQLSAGQRRIVDNFENGDLEVNAMGSAVTTSVDGILTFMEDELFHLVQSSPHDTGGLRVTWVAPSWVRWSIPNSAPLGVGPLRDVSGYTYLSLRAAQVYLNTYNTEGEDQDFQVRLYTGAGYSAKVPVSLHGRVPYPDPFICNSVFYCGIGVPTDYTKSAMTTIRIPLSAFTGADLTDVRYVYLYFDLPEHPQGSITVDSLELVQ
ncbi:MAG TPA: hypothetical protein VGX68_08965 [Thermoanaerobaculia bacterium]|jgi:hypothetical protein|nr:hypothetical protein [Thermoanaerobaculia bacterium]